MMPQGYSNDFGAESLEQTSYQFLGKGLKKHVVNFSDAQYINTIFESIDSGCVACDLQRWVIKIQFSSNKRR
jgi:hypothetical protein